MTMKIENIRQIELIKQMDKTRKIEQYKQQVETLNKLASSSEITRQTIDGSFGEMLKQLQSQQEELKISKHAQMRADERGIDLNPMLIRDIQNAVDKAKDKGIKDLAVIGDQGAFIVNVPNNIMITSMDKMEMKENVFTNINGAVLI